MPSFRKSEKSLARALLVLLLLLGQTAFAQAEKAAPAIDVPAALQPWRDWVLHERDFLRCPAIFQSEAKEAGDFYCAWPGPLSLKVSKLGAQMSQHWQLSAPSWIPLPGDAAHWPQQIRVNGQAHPVLMSNDSPALYLPAGRFDVTAEWAWSDETRPEQLRVPAMIGLVQLTLDGKTIDPIQRDAEELRLGRAENDATAQRQSNSLALQVHRKLDDGLPPLLTSVIQLETSGVAREVIIGPVLPAGFEPIGLSSPWPAQWLSDRRLKVQVRAGIGQIQLRARAIAPLTRLKIDWPDAAPDSDAPPENESAPDATWPTQEVWSYQDAPQWRSSSLSGGNERAQSIDPAQAQVPNAWRALPAFVVQSGGELALEQRGRGLSSDARNSLSLVRDLWLDFDGTRFFARDQLSGEMKQGWRLDVAAPYRMERAGDAPSDAPSDISQNQNFSQAPSLASSLLITQGGSAELSGVEWRNPRVALDASLRLASAGFAQAIPVHGWQQSLDQVTTLLHLPAGYRLLAAQGVDEAPGSWLAKWTLLDVFYAALIGLLALRWLGRRNVVWVAAYWLLAIHEFGAPQWTLGLVLALGLAHKALLRWQAKAPENLRSLNTKNRLQQTLWLGTGALLVLLSLEALQFIPSQVRSALYPQLERSFASYNDYGGEILPPMAYQPTPAAPAALDEPVSAADTDLDAAMSLNHASSLAAKSEAEVDKKIKQVMPRVNKQRYTPATLLQTGAPQPQWDLGNNYQLSWNGPVLSEQSMRLIISPLWLTRLWRVTMALLLGLSLLRIAQYWWRQKPAFTSESSPMRLSKPKSSLGVVVAALFLGLLLSLGAAPNAQAATAQDSASTAFPPAELLTKLGQRLQKNAPCWPDCASLARAELKWQSNTRFVLGLEWHVGTELAIPLPQSPAASGAGSASGLSLQSVLVDGQSSTGLIVSENTPWLSLTRGVHWVELSYTLHGDSAALQFALPPKKVSVLAEQLASAWQIEGLDEGLLLNDTLQLTRQSLPTPPEKNTQQAPANTASAQAFSPYVRVTRELQLDLDWNVTTHVERLTASDSGISLSIALLPGEHVTTAGIKVQEAAKPGERAQALVSLPSGVASASWTSRLDKSDEIKLTAPALSERAERWRLLVGPSWHAEWQGIPPDAPTSASTEAVSQFSPLPDETLTLSLRQPTTQARATLTIDQVTLRTDTGLRASTSTLNFRLRASQGGEHRIKLPTGDEAFELQQVMRDNTSLNLQVQDGQLSLPILPGDQSFTVVLRRNVDLGWLGLHLSSPTIDLGAPSANINLGWNLPEQRWLLAVRGPTQGPVILWWGELIVALALAYLLTKRPWLGLKRSSVVLLVLGFSTFSWLALCVVLLWHVALQWRARQTENSAYHRRPRWFDLGQIALLFFSALALGCLIAAVPQGLLGQPDMHWIQPNEAMPGAGINGLRWFADQATGILPRANVFSLPMWCYRSAMLLWALWLAVTVFSWLKMAFSAWSSGGYWQTWRRPRPPSPSEAKP